MGAGNVAQQRAGGVVAGRPVHVSAGMGSGAAQIKAGDDVAMTGPSGDRPVPQHLLGDELGMEDLAAFDPVGPLDVDREEDLARKNRVRKLGASSVRMSVMRSAIFSRSVSMSPSASA